MVKKGNEYPEWVRKHEAPGKRIRERNGSYYLYRRTSERVPGKKNPQPKETYIGVITENGLIESGKRKVTIDDIVVKEYGLSRTIQELCPDSWKKVNGEHWEDILTIIITEMSPNSYLTKERTVLDKSHFPRCAFGAQKAQLWNRIKNEKGIDKDEILKLNLDRIYTVYLKEKTVISSISDDQRKFFDEKEVQIDVY